MRARLVIALVAIAACRDAPPRSPAVDTAPAVDPNAPAPPPNPTGSPGCGKPARAGVTTQKARVGNRDRSYLAVVPDGYAPETRYPLIVVLHGSGGNAASARASTDLERVAAGKAIFLYLDGGGEWDLDSAASTNPDVAFFDLALLTTHNALCVAPHRTFVTGFSNGAYMANQLACRRGEAIRGVVAHSGGGPYELQGNYDAQGNLVCPQKAVASLVVHGMSDGTVAPSEGQKSLDHWSHANRCGTSTSAAWLPPCVSLGGCVQPVGICRIQGLGHGLWREAGRVTWAFVDGLR
jgi:polyhydroxybutyrate depolymerase